MRITLQHIGDALPSTIITFMLGLAGAGAWALIGTERDRDALYTRFSIAVGKSVSIAGQTGTVVALNWDDQHSTFTVLFPGPPVTQVQVGACAYINQIESANVERVP